jgi:hypothetical protein
MVQNFTSSVLFILILVGVALGQTSQFGLAHISANWFPPRIAGLSGGFTVKFTNTTLEQSAVTALIKEMADSSKLPGLTVFRLQLFIPLAALRGLVLPEKLCHVDHIEPAEGLSNGTFSVLNDAGFERHRHADTLLNICGQVGLPRRLSLGECLTCESHRSQKRSDLFLHRNPGPGLSNPHWTHGTNSNCCMSQSESH